MSLADFCNLPEAKMAGLKPHHTAVLRFYTLSSFPKFNQPMRDGACPHPGRFVMYVLADALKRLCVVDAQLHPEDLNQEMVLYRGMANMEFDVKMLKAVGGTELAPMSTTDSKDVATAYAKSERPLVFVFKTKALSRGSCIKWLSLYPREVEYLYPPLTFLSFLGDSYVKEDGITYQDIEPQMS